MDRMEKIQNKFDIQYTNKYKPRHLFLKLNLDKTWSSVSNSNRAESIYGWNSPGGESLLDECHPNVCTLGLLTRSVLIEIALGFLRLVRNCHGKDDIKKYQ